MDIQVLVPDHILGKQDLGGIPCSSCSEKKINEKPGHDQLKAHANNGSPFDLHMGFAEKYPNDSQDGDYDEQ
jgi:hypothetical protein